MTTSTVRSPAAVIGACVVGGWWATGLDPFSMQATVVVLAAGVVSMAVGRARGRARSVHADRHDLPRRSLAPWVGIAGALVAWQLAAYSQHPRADHPTLSSLANAALDPRPVRAAAFAAWLLAAGWLARR